MLKNEELEEYISAFIMDVKEYIETMSECMYKLEKDNNDKEAINKIFRSIHSIKGGAGFLNLKKMAQIAHEYESLLSKVREENSGISKTVFDLLFLVVNILEKFIYYIEKNGKEPDENSYLETLGFDVEYLNNILNNVKNVINSINDKELNTEKLNLEQKDVKSNLKKYKIFFEIDNNITMKNARILILLKKIMFFGKCENEKPSEQEILKNEYLGNTFECILSSDKDKSEIENVFKINDVINYKIEIFEQKNIEKIASEEKEHKITDESLKVKEYIKIERKKIDFLMDSIGELVIDKSMYNQLIIGFKKIYNNFNGEFGIDKKEIKKFLNLIENFKKLNKSFGRTIDRLQEEANSMRVIPLRELFSRFPRVLRELAIKLNKDIEFEIHGEDTKLDKLIVEGISDPLMHILRNAIDHGIEKRDERIKAKKPEKGKIILEAINSGNNIVIRITDDGMGIDCEKITEKAIEKGLISKEKAEKMSQEEKVKIIFIPGFSTAEEVSDISGRGVGMDVVANNIKKLKGKIEINTEVGKGTTFNIILPLTLLITKVLLIRQENMFYAIPIEEIDRTIRVKRENLEFINNKEVLRVKNKLVEIFDLSTLLNLKKKTEKNILNVVILKGIKNIYGFKVHSFIGQQEIVIKNIEGEYHKGTGIKGAAILGDGKVAMVIDSEELLEYYFKNSNLN